MLSRREGHEGGFTITEILIVVALVGVLLAAAAPSLSSMFINNRLDTAANELMAALNFARSEAIRRGTNVRVESAAGALTRDWTTGWRVYVVSGGEVLRVGQPQAQPVTVFNVSSSSLRIEYLSTGRKDESTDFVFITCYGGAPTGTNPKSRSRGVIVNATGATSLAPADADGRPLRPPLSPLTSCTTYS